MEAQSLLLLVGNILRAQFPGVLSEPKAFGSEADFLAQTSDQRNIVVEVKQGTADADRVRQALFQIGRYRELLGADTALIVFEQVPPEITFDVEIPTDAADVHVVELSQLQDVLDMLAGRSVQSASGRRSGRVLAVALPPGHDSQVVMATAIAPIAQEFHPRLTGITTVASAQTWQSGDIRRVLRDCWAVLIDLTDADPDILFVFGYSLGLNRRVIALSRGDVPSPAVNLKIVRYDMVNLELLKQQLRKELGRVLPAASYPMGQATSSPETPH
jgi:hypothetical protein